MWFIWIVLLWFLMTVVSTVWVWYVDRHDSMYLCRPHYSLKHICLTSFGLWYLLLPIATLDFMMDRKRIKRQGKDGKL